MALRHRAQDRREVGREAAHIEQSTALPACGELRTQRSPRGRFASDTGGELDECRIVACIQLRHAQMMIEACRDARGKSLAGHSQHRTTGPDRVRRGGVRVVRRGVEEKIRVPVAREVVRVRQLGHEHETRIVDTVLRSVRAQALVRAVWATQQPQHRIGHRAQNAEHAFESRRIDLETVVETDVDDRGFRQSAGAARGRLGDHAGRI